MKNILARELLTAALILGLSACAGRMAPGDEQPEIFRKVVGTWDWAGRPGTCRDEPHTLSFTPDGRFMLLQVVPASPTDTSARVVRYEIRGHTDSTIRAAIVDPPETRRTPTGETVVWDLVLINLDEYRWHRTDWREGGMTAPLIRCTAGARASADSGTGSSRGITLQIPDSIAAFQMSERKDFGGADGVMLRYRRADGLTGDVFIYAGPDLEKDCDIACARDVIRREGDDFIGSFPELIRRGYVDSIAVASDSALTPPPNSVWRLGRHMRFRTIRDGSPQWSDFYVYYLPDYRVKIRASYARDSSAARAIGQLAAAAAPTIAGSRRAALPDKDNDGKRPKKE